MIKHLQTNNRILVLIITLFMSLVGTKTMAQTSGYPHAFSVSNSQQVYYSPGNLQYRASTNTWRFAINPWDCVGDANSNISSTYDGWIDLFGWGTSGYNHGATAYQPWSTSTTNSQYYAYGWSSCDLFDQTGQADWGYNAISNGGNTENDGWRTLTKAEWVYLFNTRSTSSGIRYAKATVSNVNGMIVLPDDWSTDYYVLNNTNSSGASFSSNTISSTQWDALERHGAVFLPAAGNRDGTSVYDVGSGGYYWSATYYSSNYACYVVFNGSYLDTGYYNRYSGRSVRLVRSVQDYSFGINATPSPAEGGAVSGAGAYMAGAVCTLTATPSAGYAFGCWTEEGVAVSWDATYTFIAVSNRYLVANFVAPGNIMFADANVKAVCVANWDIDGDGELSYAEAAKVTDLGDVFKNNTSIHSFNELQYFISLSSIGEQAFYGCTELTQVTIPEHVASIGNMAFYGCTELTQVTIPEHVASIGNKAFWNCPALQTVYYNAVSCNTMQSTYNSNTYSVFSSNSSGDASALTRVVIGSSVTRIPDHAFHGSSDIYQRLVIPASVTEIGNDAFDGCSSIPLMLIQGNGLLTIGDYAFRNCSALANALNLPNSVTTVGQFAFYGCTLLPSLTIGEGVTTIGGYAFWSCPALTTVNFNATNCNQMYTRTGTSSSNYQYYSVFNRGTSNGGATPIVNLSIGDNVTRIPDYAFRNSSNAVGALLLPETLTYVGQRAFSGCNSFIGDLTIPNAVAEIGAYAFYNCSGFNGTLTLSNALSTINNYTLYGCSGLTGTLTIPESITTIGSASFQGCSGFTGPLAIHDGMVSVGDYAFYGCSGIPELTIGEGVTTIGGYAFWNCPQLQTVHFNATNCNQMYTRTGTSSSNYQYYSVFNSGTSNGGATPIVALTIGDNVTIIPNYAFKNSPNLVGILRFPDILSSIGQYAFQGCSGFTGDLVFPNSVTSLGSYAFKGCNGFDGSLVLGSGIAAINPYTFDGCSGFTESLIIGRAVNSIGDYAFRNCSGFTSLIAENPAPITATSSSFTGMNYTIPVHVPYGLINNYQNATGWNSFTNYKNQFTFEQLDNANWSDAMNWYTFELPGPDDVVCVNSNCNLDVDANVLRVYVLNLNDVFTVNSGQTLGVNYGVGILQGSQLVLEEGSQLINNLPGVQGTIQLNLGGKGRDGDGWFTIAAPIYGGMPVNTLTTGDYDLFAYDEPTHYWRNQKVADNAITKLSLGQGYLYANQSVTSLSLSGELNPSNATVTVPVTYEGTPLEGYTLVGNPYTNNLNIADVQLNGTPLTTYYKVHGGGSLVAYTDADPIHPGEGFLVMASEGGTLTFGPSRGQSHDSDDIEQRDEGVPLGGFRLPAHGDLIDVNAYTGEIQYVSITAVANATEYGTVSGGGSYTVGSTCTLAATPNENYSFINWTENGTVVSTNTTYTFTVTGARTLVANFSLNNTETTQTTALTNGWNWWSSYIELNGIDGLTLLENSLGNNGLVVKSRENGFVESYDNNGSPLWYGTLNAINNEQMYMIRTNADCAALLTGQPASPANHPVTINPGWNWIGYPNKQAISVETAFSGFTPAANDVVKGRYHYTTYYNENGNSLWYGTLNSFEPGQGYMYQSNANGVKTLTFSGSKGEDVQANIAMDGNIFKPNTEAFANTMTVTAVVETEGIELRSDNYELAAFVGDECRGSVKLMFVAPLNRYVAFLTVFGEPDDEILFRLTDGNGTTTAAERCAFVTDGTLGSLTQPRVLHFGNLGVEDDKVSSVSVYPNPVEKGQLFRITLPASFGNATVEIIDVMGRIILTRRDARHCVSTPDTPGVYTVRVIGEQGHTWHGKIIVK